MKLIYGISVTFFIIVLHAVSEGKNLPEFQDITEPKENLLDVQYGESSDSPENNTCGCNKAKCQCCYNFVNVSVCTSSRVIRLVNEKDDLAIQGTLAINNGPVFTGSIKFNNIPKMCYSNEVFNVCLILTNDVVYKDQVKVCGQMNTSYLSTTMHIDLFCETFEVIRKEDRYAVKETENIENTLISSLELEPLIFQKIDFNMLP